MRAVLVGIALFPLQTTADGTDAWTKVVGNSIVPLGDGFGAGGVLNTNNTGVQTLDFFNGFLYAAVQTTSSRPSIWRSSDLLNWTNVASGFPAAMHNIFDMQSCSNGIFFGTGYGGTSAQVWKSTNGVNWIDFTGGGSGYLAVTTTPVLISLQGNSVYAAPESAGCQVWKRPADGSALWAKVLDFSAGFGTADGVNTNMSSNFIYAPPGATNAVFLPCWDNSAGCLLYESADGGATWHQNAGAGRGFGDTNNGVIASMIEFNGYLYAGTGNIPEGGQIWRTPLTNAVNWSSTGAWQQVASGGFGNSVNQEFHRFAVAGGELWTFFMAHNGQLAQVWRSGDGTNWVQSNVNGFGTSEVASPAGALASFISSNGNAFMVWGGTWVVNPTNASVDAAQVWATQLPAQFSITTTPPLPPGTLGLGYGTALAATNGTCPYTWAIIDGGLPGGLNFDGSGSITGSPTTAGTFNFIVQVNDAIGQTATGAFSIVVTDPWSQFVGNSIVPLGDGFGAGGVMNTNNTVIQSLTAYNGFLYAAVETVSNQPTIWRSSDLINWMNVVSNFHVNMRNIFDMQSNTNGIFFGTGYGGSPTGAQVWKSTDGVTWSVFSTAGSGFYETNFQIMISLQGNKLYASIGPPITNASAEVWERPADGSANWTKLLDFNTGLGSADGPLTNVGYSFIYAPPGATNAVFLPCNNSTITNCWIYQTADGGATWHKNVAAGTGFGDNYNAYITCIIEFNGYLYVGTGNPTEGAQIWRKPLADAVNWSSTNAWQQVASGGLVNKSNGEFHRFAVAYGNLWTYLTANGPKGQVWRSNDGINWVQSNVDGFGTTDYSFVGSLGSFTSTNGNAYMVCGSEWLSPTNSNINAAQVWASQIPDAPALDSVGDGIPDWWRAQYFPNVDPTGTTTNYLSCATSDADSTGQNNLFKYLAGLNPTNPASIFRILSIAPTGNDLNVTWQTAGGKTNVLTATGNLTVGYTNASPNLIIQGTGDTTTNWLDPGGATNRPARFYRVKLP